MGKIALGNIPTGHDGEGFVTLRGNVVPAFKFSKLALNAAPITEGKRFLRERVTQTAVRGLNITGNMSYYHCTSALIEAIEEYKNGGEYPEITVQGFAEVSGTGRCEIMATGVVINNIGLISFDDTSDSATIMDSDLTANNFEVISKFNQ